MRNSSFLPWKVRHQTLRGIASGLALWVLVAPGAAPASASTDGHDPETEATTSDASEHAEQAEQEGEGGHGHSSRLSAEALELQLDGFPQRPKPILELVPLPRSIIFIH